MFTNNDGRLSGHTDLIRLHVSVAERPQHMLMRVSVGIHEDDIAGAIEVSTMVLIANIM